MEKVETLNRMMTCIVICQEIHCPPSSDISKGKNGNNNRPTRPPLSLHRWICTCEVLLPISESMVVSIILEVSLSFDKQLTMEKLHHQKVSIGTATQ